MDRLCWGTLTINELECTPWTHLSSSLNRLTIIGVHFYMSPLSINGKRICGNLARFSGGKKIFDIHCGQGKCNKSPAHWTESGLHVQINCIYPSSGCLISHSRNTHSGFCDRPLGRNIIMLIVSVKRSRGSQNTHLDQLWMIHWDINYVKYLMNPKLP